MTLTPEGQKLLSAWGPMAKAFLREAEELRSKDTEDTTIRVGLGDVTNLDRYFIPLSSAFSAEEECSFRFVLKPGFDLFDELASGSCDVVFAPKFMERGFSQYPDLDWLFAVPSPLYAGLAESNPLRAKSALRVEDLRDMEVFILSLDEGSWCRWYNEMIQELSAAEMEGRCRNFTTLRTADMFGAMGALKRRFDDVRAGDGHIRVYNVNDTEAIVDYLMKNGHVVSEIQKNRVGLEEYYIELMSGKGATA